MDFTKIHNPYDFANPVKDIELFVGRKNELDEIKYYLNHAKTAPRPINLAILGKRASGKTSLLNICEVEAKERNFCVVRVDLDESDVLSQLIFFKKIFDCILFSVLDLNSFGGKEGKTYDLYLDMVNGFSVPDDKTFCPFIFPIQYAKAMSFNNTGATLSDNEFKNDLIKISNEVQRPIIILFDECNVLAKSRVLLEKIRNIFMNTSGYMLVFTGTEDLFPIMDDVFSPIIRQFKKINIAEFKSFDETENCIRKPLEKLDIKPEDIFDFETLNDVTEIHDLSGGKPYEIQLICHVLFRRIQDKKTNKMKLDLSVLEDVRKELETSQDITVRPVLNFIRTIDRQHLKSLNILCSCEKRATLDQVWFFEYVFSASNKFSKDFLNKEFEFFIGNNVLRIENGFINLNGDDFDRIYIKYFAREQKIRFNFNDFPLEFYWYIRVSNFFKINKILLKTLSSVFLNSKESLSEDYLFKNLSEDKIDDEFISSDNFETIYQLYDEYQNSDKIYFLTVNLDLEWLKSEIIFYPFKTGDFKSLESAYNKIDTIRLKIEELGGNFSSKIISIPVIPISELLVKIMATSNDNLKTSLSEYHTRKMVDKYIKNSNIESIIADAEMALKYNHKNNSVLNNYGYLNYKMEKYEKAELLFNKAIEAYIETKEDYVLPLYNLAILKLKLGNQNKALELLEKCNSLISSAPLLDRTCSCLFIPTIRKDKIVIEECKDSPNLEKVVVKGLEVLRTFQLNL